MVIAPPPAGLDAVREKLLSKSQIPHKRKHSVPLPSETVKAQNRNFD
jgi:hypothetical protein